MPEPAGHPLENAWHLTFPSFDWLRDSVGVPAFIGRTGPRAQLSAAYEALTTAPGDAVSGWAGLVLVIGEATVAPRTCATAWACTTWPLPARPGVDLLALDLTGGLVSERSEPILDRPAVMAYRKRLPELDSELDAADARADLARRQRAGDEREQLLAELHRATQPDGRSRTLRNTVTERARKAVTARIRDATHRITDAHPDLGTHVDRSIGTGTTCRYDAHVT